MISLGETVGSQSFDLVVSGLITKMKRNPVASGTYVAASGVFTIWILHSPSPILRGRFE